MENPERTEPVESEAPLPVHGVIRLNREDSLMLMELYLNPPPMNAALRDLLENYSDIPSTYPIA